jgi:hypothetical protein
MIKHTELERYLSEQPLNYCRLMDAAGRTIVGFNTKPSQIPAQIKKFQKSLNASINPEGRYTVEHRVNYGDKNNCQLIAVAKGEVREDEPAAPPMPSPRTTAAATARNSNPDVISYSRALELQTEIARLTFELAAANNKIAELEAELNDPGEDEPATALSETPSPMQPALERIAVQLVEKFFENQERKIAALEALAQQQPRQTPQQKQQADYINAVTHEVKQADPDTLTSLIEQAKQAGEDYYRVYMEIIRLHRPEFFTSQQQPPQA